MKAFQKGNDQILLVSREDEMAAAICGMRTKNIDMHR